MLNLLFRTTTLKNGDSYFVVLDDENDKLSAIKATDLFPEYVEGGRHLGEPTQPIRNIDDKRYISKYITAPILPFPNVYCRYKRPAVQVGLGSSQQYFFLLAIDGKKYRIVRISPEPSYSTSMFLQAESMELTFSEVMKWFWVPVNRKSPFNIRLLNFKLTYSVDENDKPLLKSRNVVASNSKSLITYKTKRAQMAC